MQYLFVYIKNSLEDEQVWSTLLIRKQLVGCKNDVLIKACASSWARLQMVLVGGSIETQGDANTNQYYYKH